MRLALLLVAAVLASAGAYAGDDPPLTKIPLTPGTVMVRLSIGGDVYCAAFETFQRRRRGALVARYNPPPASCTADAPNG